MKEREAIDRIIQLAIEEDQGENGDISSSLIFSEKETAQAVLTAKEDGIVAGFSVASMVLSHFDETAHFQPCVTEGATIRKGESIATISASVLTLLSAERIILNFMQRMSGIATIAHRYQEACKGTKCRILDTRKTVPGLRILDKMAVRAGGAYNHRIGLYDMVMLKDNHIKASGSITEAVKKVREFLPLSVKVEVETSNLNEVAEALKQQVDIIMLDNMPNEMMAEAVRLIDAQCITEASGNMTLERIPSVAALGVDYISVGALTHSVKALDISMNFTID